MENQEQTSQSNNPTFTPISCPNCKSKNIKFITEYHKCISLRIVTLFCAIIAVVLFRIGAGKSALVLADKAEDAIFTSTTVESVEEFENLATPPNNTTSDRTSDENRVLFFYIVGGLFTLLALICFISYLTIEARTHVQCVCPNCGNVWLHN
ncbi:MAG: hypothetical protein IJ329_00765 [Clostridia bacterium]|nr:hypothetical protein [Clostridia bacterium]